MLAGKKTFIGIVILAAAGLVGIDPDTAVQAAGIDVDAQARAIAQVIVIVVGAAIAVYGRIKAQPKPEGEAK